MELETQKDNYLLACEKIAEAIKLLDPSLNVDFISGLFLAPFDVTEAGTTVYWFTADIGVKK